MDFLRQIWRVRSYNDLASVDIEECLDLVATPGETIAGRYNSDVIFGQLTELVVRYLAHCDYQMSKIGLKASGHEGYHTPASLWLYRLGNGLFGRPPYAFVSLNWDLLVDKATWEYAPYNDISMVDCLLSMYGFFPKEVYDGDKVYRHVRRTAFKKIADIPLLLKLHGSANWFRCPKCQYLRVENNLRAIESLVRFPNQSHHRCPNDRTPLRLAIVPPVWNKKLGWGPFPSIWRSALDSLSDTDHLVVIGVGFREADVGLRSLLRKAASYWRKTPRITLVGRSIESRAYVRKVTDLLQTKEHHISVFRDLRALLGNNAPWPRGTHPKKEDSTG